MGTERTTSDITGLLADNGSGAISPQDVRQAIDTALGGYGSIVLSISGAPVTLNSVAQTPIAITQYDVLASQSVAVNTNGTTANATNGTLTVGLTGVYFIAFFASFSVSQNNKTVHFQPHINGSVGLVEVDRFVGTGSDVGVVAMQSVIPYTEDDVIDVRVFIDSGTANITFEALGFCIFRVG